ncbi:hypothetical protein [Thiothrix sp.]|jgi:hypothetical protein|uniref:hypothetical protein n=1 Tax=Thiothrix sp. TaxID=1032 RepID=UPI00257ECCF2|nr:hypothetical protein [Thiothrix sp.]
MSEGKGNGEGSKVAQFKAGKPKTGGRQQGTPNKHRASVREIAAQYVDDVLDVLARIAADETAPAAARVAAARELLDRCEGKPAQRIEQVVSDTAASNKYNDIATKIRLEQLALEEERKFYEKYGR